MARAWDGLGELIGEGVCDVVAFGKASGGMAAAVMERLGTRVRRGIVLAAAGREEDAERLRARWPGVRVHAVDHPMPTERNVRAAADVERFVAEGSARADGATLLVLISGGGSAHLTLPATGIALGEIAEVSARLMRSGADIAELNTVRKHLERLKGGRLAELACGAEGAGYVRVVGVVVSDVIGDDVSVIASGPLTPDPTTYADAMRVLERRGIARSDAPAAWRHLERGARGEIAETPKRAFDRVAQRVIGSNTNVVRAAIAAVERLGFEVIEWRESVTGEAAERGRALAIVWGGETTVTVGENGGTGGRNQEFALAAAEGLARAGEGTRIAVMSFATDGVDGPTDAAGAVVNGQSWRTMQHLGLDPECALAVHDSHGVLEAAGALIRTGPTGTNVNDVMVAMVYPSGDERREVQR